jgi:hypothetical protein
MVCQYLTQIMGMKCRHLRWVPHTLIPGQKVMRTELAHSSLQALAKREHMNYHFLFSCDES